MSRILITGGTGFIGSRVAHFLHRCGNEVIVLSRKPAVTTLSIIQGDINDRDALLRATENIDIAFHFAGLAHKPDSPQEQYYRINVDGTKHFMESCVQNGVRRIVIASSISVYGRTSKPAREADECNPINAYGKSKYLAELLATEIASKTGICLMVLRLGTVYGEGDPGNVLKLIRIIRKLGPIVIGEGANRKSLTYVGNIASLCGHVVYEFPQGVSVFNVADTRPYEMVEIIETAARLLGHTRRSIHIPIGIAVVGADLMTRMSKAFRQCPLVTVEQIQTLTENAVIDTAKLTEHYGPQIAIGLEEGLSKTISWLIHKKA